MKRILFLSFLLIIYSCKETKQPIFPGEETTSPGMLVLESISIDGISNILTYNGVSVSPKIKLTFSQPIDTHSVQEGIVLKHTSNSSSTTSLAVKYEQNNRTLKIESNEPLDPLTKYSFQINEKLLFQKGGKLASSTFVSIHTAIDSIDKFDRISESELLDKVQQQTFKYFWDFGHPHSGLIRERDSSGDVVTTGGTGFGIMAMIVAAERGFISRTDAYSRIEKIVTFLKTADHYHGVFPHWLNGQSGKTIPFSTYDDGADLLETSLLFQGLLTAKQYFNTHQESKLVDDIVDLYDRINWDFFTRGQNVLYWHWSPNYAWKMNLKIEGWNESLITYVLAAGSTTFPITKNVYDHGWARDGSMKNNKSFYGFNLPLGVNSGGPLFLSQYSFLGMNPFGLKDQYANYEEQVVAHTNINQAYCALNPHHYYGYSEDCWGLTASDGISGYSVHSPTQDNGVISPTAALSSYPFTPEASNKVLEFMYYKLGDKLWGNYGFKDAFSLHAQWFANSNLAINQGPIIIMIENHRTALLWNLFMKDEIAQTGLKRLGFTSPYLN